MNFLLQDEEEISSKDLEVRRTLYEAFMNLPKEFVSKMRHLQPQVGCFNNCGFCSKFSVCKSEYWDERSLRSVIAALKYTAKQYTDKDILLAWERNEHRVGVIFPYLNNDVASYLYLDKYIDLVYRELGARTRISTVGYSRHNEELNRIHRKINSSALLYALGGVRLSISQYGRVWEEPGRDNSLEEYVKDLSNFLKIYRPYFDMFGSGSRKMCVELRYNPLVMNSAVLDFELNEKRVIATGNYLYISKGKNIEFNVSHISDPFVHALRISEEPFIFEEYNLPFEVSTEKELTEYINNNKLNFEKDVEVYLFENKDGKYYAIDPKIKDNGNYGFNIYPKTEIRKKSGYIITERFLLNALAKFKSRWNLNLRDKFTKATWRDVNKVLDICRDEMKYYSFKGKNDKVKYIEEHVLPVVSCYVEALKDAKYPADCFFDSKFTIDTGTICNLGRALGLFNGLTKYVNEPLTPAHERNYGRRCSTMKEENMVWLLACGYNNTLNIESLDLFKTASVEGQVSYMETINMKDFNQKIDEKGKYLYPGSKE